MMFLDFCLYYTITIGGEIMKPENSEIGLRIRQQRECQRFSREKLAEMSGISTQFLADIETGKKGMTVTTLKKICDSLNITSDYLIYGKNENNHFNFEAIFSSFDKEKQGEIIDIFSRIVRLAEKSQ